MTQPQVAVPIVADHEIDDKPFFNGAGIFESAQGIYDGLSQGDWLDAGGNAFAFAFDLVGAITDPLQTVISAGVGWLIEYCRPLKEPLDWLAGNVDAIQNNSKTWANIRVRVNEAARQYAEALDQNMAMWQSRAGRAFQNEARTHIEAMQSLSLMAAVGEKGVAILAGVIALVRNTIRDIIADIIGAIISKAIQAATVILAPKALAEIALLIAKVTNKILNVLERLVRTVRRLLGLVEDGGTLMKQIREAYDSVRGTAVTQVLGSGISDGAGAGSKFGAAWGVVAGGTPVRSAAQSIGESVVAGLKGNLRQEAGKAAQNLKDRAQDAADEVRRQEALRQQQAAAGGG
ncbi:MAG TPA: hypothetical protein VF062_16325 [Candidatus Limnocylindrales bacterium]